MKLMVENPSDAAKDYIHDCAVTEGIAYYEKDGKAWLTGDDEHLLETLMKELKKELPKGQYKDIYLD